MFLECPFANILYNIVDIREFEKELNILYNIVDIWEFGIIL
jgi:hypothetical protein